MIIKNIEKEELRELISVYQSGYKGIEKYAYTDKKRIYSYLKWLYNKEPEGFFVAEIDGKKIGFAVIHSNWLDKEIGLTAELHEICIAKEYQGKGVGTKLFLQVLQYAKIKKRDKMSLWVGEENFKARNWYKRLGFKETGKYNEWIRMIKSI